MKISNGARRLQKSPTAETADKEQAEGMQINIQKQQVMNSPLSPRGSNVMAKFQK